MSDRSERRPARDRGGRPAAEAGDFQRAKPRRVDVVNAYRWILGREPEDAGVVARHASTAQSNAMLRSWILESEEFLRAGPAAHAGLPREAPPPRIETEATAAALAAMQAQLAAGWSRLAEKAIHHSCLPDPRFTPERITTHRSDFFATGRDERALLEGVLARQRIEPGSLGTLVEFGCGVGRATLHLAAIFPEVTGLDISAPHLALARTEARARGMEHIAWRRCRPDQPMPVTGCGLWFSRRVLQHCPPPLARRLLELAFQALAPGGVAVFQLLTHGGGYGFAAGDPVADPPALHVLPQAAVFAAAREAGLAMLEVLPDPLPGLDQRRWVSHLFVARRV
jgi:SAM-dependent methyltransferase